MVFLLTILAMTVLFIATGCDEGVNMAGQVMMEPPEDPMINGEMKQPDEGSEPDSEKPETPTLLITDVMPADDGSVTISGTSTELPQGETVTITVVDTVTVTTTTDGTGAWSVTIPASETTELTEGTVVVEAVVDTATDESSFEYDPPYTQQPGEGMSISEEEAERIKMDIVTDDYGEEYAEHLPRIYERLDGQYGSLFDLVFCPR